MRMLGSSTVLLNAVKVAVRTVGLAMPVERSITVTDPSGSMLGPLVSLPKLL